MTCINGEIQMYYPVIAKFTADYEKQLVITGIKSGMYCHICTIPSGKHENLCKKGPLQTHTKL